MSTTGATRDTLPAFLHDLDKRLGRVEHRRLATGAGSGGAGLDAEAVVDAVAAVLVEGTGIDIVYDDAGNTITITSTSVDEVWVGPGTPPGPQEVWYDTDAAAAGSVLPAGGTARQVLSKNSSSDGDASWRDPTWLVVKTTAPVAADYGVSAIPLGAIWIEV